MKIYTKTGDKGMTSLFGGTRVSKDYIQIESYGTVDELNAHIGLLISLIEEKDLLKTLKAVQSILFDIGSHLASDGKADDHLPQLEEHFINELEKLMDSMTLKLPPLKAFILPGGNQRISIAHICRTICRRAERRVISLEPIKALNPLIIIYLNRLSDYFFVLARYLSRLDGIDEIKWNPK